MSLPNLLLEVLERSSNRVIRLDPQAAERMAAFEGRVIGFDLLGTGQRLFVLPGRTLQFVAQYEGEPDAWIVGTPLALARLGLGGDRERALFSGELKVSGDVELTHRFADALREFDIDWEEHLSRITGDVIAHQAGNLARAATRWFRRTGTILAEDLSDYLREESGLLPTRAEVEPLLQAIDAVRLDVERLEARIRRLREYSA